MEKLNFTEVLITNIVPDPNQPRHFFDQADMDDLTNSIKEKGVLQPILIRPVKGKKDQYMIVCGERRYRASKNVMTAIKDRNTIPAIVRDITDDEALELQIIENLQRKDISPMEEAVAFLSLNKKGKSNVEIGKRVGKSEFYIRQRLKLNALIKCWQDALYAKRIDIVMAIAIAAIEADGQKQLWDDENCSQDNDRIDIDRSSLKHLLGCLDDANFDLTDPSLDKKMGACVGCAFNTATALLFPDDAVSPRCNKISCFTNKSYLAFDKELQIAVLNEEVTLIQPSNSTPDDVMKAIEKSGYKILRLYDQSYNRNFNIIEPPFKPDLNDLDDYDPKDYKSHDEMIKEYEKDMREYDKKVIEFNKRVNGGKFQKGFSVYGSSRGKYLYIDIIKRNQAGSSSNGSGSRVATSSAEVKEKQLAGKLTAADITGEITRIKERLDRGAALDMQKIHAATLEEFNKRPELSSSKPKMMMMHKNDRGLLAYMLLESIGTYTTVSGIPKPPGGKDKYNVEYFHDLNKINDQQLALLIRVAVKKKFGSVNLQYGLHTGDTTVRIICEYLGVDLKKIEDAVKVGTDKREASAKKRIAELNTLKAELTKPLKAPEKVNESAVKNVKPAATAKKLAPPPAKKKAVAPKKVARAKGKK